MSETIGLTPYKNAPEALDLASLGGEHVELAEFPVILSVKAIEMVRSALEETDGVTQLRYEADLKVGGKLAQVGSRLVLGVTQKIADEFFGAFSTILDAGAEKVETDEDRLQAQKKAARKRIMMIVGPILMLLLIYWLVS